MAIRRAVKNFLGGIKQNYNYFKLGVKDAIENDSKAKAERLRYRKDAIRRGLLDPEKENKIKSSGGI